MSTGLRRLLAMTLATATMLSLVFFIVTLAEAQVANTCKDLGFPDNLETDTSGVWGSVAFDNTEDTLTLVVNDGYEVTLCVKAGSINQGNGPESVGPFSAGTHIVGHTSGKDLSHYGLTFQTVTTTTGETTSTTTTTVVDTTTTTSPSSSTTTGVSSTTTTSPPGSTSTVPPPSSTTTPETTTSTTPSAPTTTVPTDPSTLPFTGPSDGLGVLAVIGGLVLVSGIGVVTWKGREE